MNDDNAKRPMPRWLRWLLMALLVAFAVLAYWLNFGDILEDAPPASEVTGEGAAESAPR